MGYGNGVVGYVGPSLEDQIQILPVERSGINGLAELHPNLTYLRRSDGKRCSQNAIHFRYIFVFRSPDNGIGLGGCRRELIYKLEFIFINGFLTSRQGHKREPCIIQRNYLPIASGNALDVVSVGTRIVDFDVVPTCSRGGNG